MKGHVATVDEPDIARAFKMDKRLDKFDVKLSEVSAHTLRILEIIWEERDNIKMKKQREMEAKMNNAS